MAFSFFKVLKGLLITQENTLTPTSVEIIPGGTASTTTTIQGSQTTNTTITLPDATDTLVGKATSDVLTNKSISATTNTITNISNTEIKTGAAIDATKLGTGTVDNTHLGYLSGVTSDVQTQINAKQDSSSAVTLTGVQSLTNKSLVDASTAIVDSVDATKQIKFDAAGTSGTSTTLTGSQTTNKVLTLPDATDTLVGKATTDSLTNKSLVDASTAVVDSVDPTKQIKFDAAGTTGTSTTITGSQTSNQVLTLPNATDTLVGKATTDSLTNKSLVDTSTAIVDSVDSTKQIKFDAAGTSGTSTTITGSQTTNKVLTLPDATDTVAVLALAQTLSNKTLTAPIVDALTMTQIATPANPSSGSNKIYVKSDGKAYTLDSSGVEKKLGSGLTTWAASTAYVVNDVVTYEKQAYICLTNNTSASAFETDIASGYWQLLNLNVNGRNYALVGNNFEDGDAGGWVTCTLGTQYTFTVTSANATIGAVYSDGSHSYTVVNTIAGSTSLVTSGTANPVLSGTLTKTSGAGDATITFSTWASLPYQAGAVPVTFVSSGATSIQTLTATSTNPISGKFSLNVSNVASTNFTAGQGIISQAFNIDNIDQAKVLANKFAYQAAAGSANMNFSGSSSNTWAAYIFDVTNNAWIQPAGVYNLVQGSGVGISAGTWQTPANMIQFRIALLCINSSTASSPAAGALQMNLDDFYIGPQATISAPAISDWQSYTLTIGGTTTSPTLGTTSLNEAKWRRVGDSIEIQYNLIQTGAGTAGSGVYLFPLPPGLSIDTTKFSTSGFTLDSFGSAYVFSGSNTYLGYVSPRNATNLQLVFDVSAASTALVGSANIPLSTASTAYSFNVKFPVLGWSSNSVMSNDTDTRVVSFSANTSTTAATTSAPFIFTLKDHDTHGAYSTSTGKFTAPVSGKYHFDFQVWASASFSLVLYKNTTGVYEGRATAGNSTSTGSHTISLLAGETVEVRPNVSATAANGASVNSFSGFMLSGPAVIAVSESINARYTNSSGQSLANSTDVVITNWTKDFDTHGAFNTTTGIYTVPVSGKYRVGGILNVLIPASTQVTSLYALISKNGSTHTFGSIVNTNVSTSAITADMGCLVSGLVNCVAGDTISIVGHQSTGAARSLDAGVNTFTIERIGN